MSPCCGVTVWCGAHRGAVGGPGDEEPLIALGILAVQAVQHVARLLLVQQGQHKGVVVSIPAPGQLFVGSQHKLFWKEMEKVVLDESKAHLAAPRGALSKGSLQLQHRQQCCPAENQMMISSHMQECTSPGMTQADTIGAVAAMEGLVFCQYSTNSCQPSPPLPCSSSLRSPLWRPSIVSFCPAPSIHPSLLTREDETSPISPGQALGALEYLIRDMRKHLDLGC